MLNIRRNCFTEIVIKHWNRSCGKVGKSLSLQKLKKRVDAVLCHMVISGYGGIWCKVAHGDLSQP